MLRYILVSIRRNSYKSLIPLALCATLVALLCVFSSSMTKQEKELETTLLTARLPAYITRNAQRYGSIELPKELAEKVDALGYCQASYYMMNELRVEYAVLDEDDKQEVIQYTFGVKDMVLSAEEIASADAYGVEHDVLRHIKFQTWLADEYQHMAQLGCANDIHGIERFAIESKTDSMYIIDEYKDTMFINEEYLVALPSNVISDLGLLPGDMIMLTCYETVDLLKWSGVQQIKRVKIPVRIAASFGGLKDIYGNFALGERICDELGMKINYHSASYILKNIETFETFKEKMQALGFVSVTVGKDEGALALVIDDEGFTTSVDAISSNLTLQRRLYPVLILSSMAMGLLAAWLLTRSRRNEYAIMRSLGMRSSVVVCTALLEQIILAATGALIGLILVFRTQAIDAKAYTTAALVLGCYCLGSTFAILLCTRANVMAIMKDKE